MASVEISRDDVDDTLRQILELSWRISRQSPPMKPFIRFSSQTDDIYENMGIEAKRLLWDFDYSLQRVLLRIAKAVASPEQLSFSCIERWKLNLEQLCARKRTELDTLTETRESFRPRHTARDNFILARIETGSRFLYLGCGSGTECLRFASSGYRVVGIDTDLSLTGVANEWATHLDLPFRAICMDAMALGFDPGSFDGFLLEFYGNQPVLSQSLTLQRSLANVLRDGGRGFVVASRRKYQSFWYKMGSRYPTSMTEWLMGQSILDHRWSEPDACEEQLGYGLYSRTHTVDSLAKELSTTFDIVECTYEDHDPRYVLCVVERKQDIGAVADARPHRVDPGWSTPADGDVPVEDALRQVQRICGFLESHEAKVVRFFDVAGTQRTNPLHAVPVNLSEFIDLLWEVAGNA